MGDGSIMASTWEGWEPAKHMSAGTFETCVWIIAGSVCGWLIWCMADLLVRLHRERVRLRRQREWADSVRQIIQINQRIITARTGSDVVLTDDDFQVYKNALSARRALQVETDDRLGLQLYGRRVYPESTYPNGGPNGGTAEAASSSGNESNEFGC